MKHLNLLTLCCGFGHYKIQSLKTYHVVIRAANAKKNYKKWAASTF
jgi:hypothetical protein